MRKGFSLIELLLVVAIAGILSVVAMVSYNSYIKKSKRDSLKPSLYYVYNLFKLNYVDKKHFGGMYLPDIDLPDGYCLQIRSGEESSQGNVSNHIVGKCRSGISQCRPRSGFVAIAYGETKELDLGINHKKEIQEGLEVKCQNLSGGSCSGMKRKECRKAACKWKGNACTSNKN